MCYSIEYHGLHTATHDGRQLTLSLLRDDASSTNVTFRLVTQRAAIALYRSVTEMHSFYRCDTVRNAVASQVCRDLKGTLASLFSEHTTLGESASRACADSVCCLIRLDVVVVLVAFWRWSISWLNLAEQP